MIYILRCISKVPFKNTHNPVKETTKGYEVQWGMGRQLDTFDDINKAYHTAYRWHFDYPSVQYEVEEQGDIE